MSHSPELRAALLAAEAAAMVIRRYYGQPIDVRTKADQSPVTEADVAAVVVFLASDAARGVTKQLVPVNGGLR